MKRPTPLSIVFAVQLILFFCIVSGVVPRSASFAMVVVFIVFSLLASIQDALVLFICSIPLFLALPLTPSFDNFNTWRIVAFVIFARWLFMPDTRAGIWAGWRRAVQNPAAFIREHPFALALVILLMFAVISLFFAQDPIAGVKRILFFLNISLVGMVLIDVLRRRERFAAQVILAIAVPTILAVIAGYFQLISTYFMDIYQFINLWGEGIQLRQFGSVWSAIAVHLGNTWFAYFGSQLSLRVFSLFPDSHSFPLFVLMGIPALFAVSFRPLLARGPMTFKTFLTTRTSRRIVWVPLSFLIIILSGTRGIWAASIGVLLWVPIILFLLKRSGADASRRNLWLYLSSYLILFFTLFLVAFPIFASPQFLLSKANGLFLEQRLASILDFGETSNAQRIAIWSASLKSIAGHPFFGVGIGNFPIVLGQDVFLARAGSSAHNLYLNIAAEMGIAALIATLWFLWLIVYHAYRWFLDANDAFLGTYAGALLLFIPWVLLYSLTDVAILDERSLLLFTVTSALIISSRHGK